MREYRQFDPSTGTTRQVEAWQPYQPPLEGIPGVTIELLIVAGVVILVSLACLKGIKNKRGD